MCISAMGQRKQALQTVSEDPWYGNSNSSKTKFSKAYYMLKSITIIGYTMKES